MNNTPSEAKSASTTYSQVLKASSIIGGAQGINLLLGLARTKFAAVLIGPIGVGLLGNYGAIQTMVGTLSGLGIQSSAVREVAEAMSKGDQQSIGRTILSLRRICWLTGLIGALAMAALSSLLSQWTFGSSKHTMEIALLSLVILLGSLSGGQMALIQGMRRIADLARLNVFGTATGTLISIGCYAWLGLQGIVPAMVLMAISQYAASSYFARRVPAPVVAMSWWESIHAAGGMARLGLAFMWTSLMVGLVGYLTRALITQQASLESVGIFSAAYALSGVFVNFVLGAMSADYYPRLTAVAGDHGAANQLVNEQTEIGLLLTVPGLLASLSLAPWIIRFFYTDAFLPATQLLQWFLLACLGRVISWPLGYVMLALGKGQWFFVTETLANMAHMGLIVLGLSALGLEGVGTASFALYLIYTTGVYAVVRRLTGFRWSPECRGLLLRMLPTVALTFVAARLLPLWPATALGLLASATAFVMCLRGLAQRIGSGHRIVRSACRLPGMRIILGLRRI